jgi:K(+)-stimulated pyrophosphate-energized sodium pump
VCFFLGVSAFSLLIAFLFARRVSGATAFLKRQYRTVAALLGLLLPTFAYAQPEHTGGGEANLVLPDLSSVSFFGMSGHALLTWGLLFCVGGLLFGLAIYVQLKNLPVHRTMLEFSCSGRSSRSLSRCTSVIWLRYRENRLRLHCRSSWVFR